MPRWFAPSSGGYSGTGGPPPRYARAEVTPTAETRSRRVGPWGWRRRPVVTEVLYQVVLLSAARPAVGMPGTPAYRPPAPPWPSQFHVVWAVDDEAAEACTAELLAEVNAAGRVADERRARTRVVTA